MSPAIPSSALGWGARPQGSTGPPEAGKGGVQLSAGSSAMDLGQICAKILQQLSFHCPFLSIVLPSATSLPCSLGTEQVLVHEHQRSGPSSWGRSLLRSHAGPWGQQKERV